MDLGFASPARLGFGTPAKINKACGGCAWQMKNHSYCPDHSSSISQGSREAFAAAAAGEGSTRAAGARKHEKKKDRSPSQVSGCDGLDVAEVGTWTGEKKTKIQSAPTSSNLCMIARDDGELSDKLPRSPPRDSYDMDMKRPDEQQYKELMSRLALYRIRSYKGDELKGLDEEQLKKRYPLHTLEAQGYYEWCESDLEWFFDPDSFNYVGFEDYQRLVLRNNVLRNNGEYEYEYWESYCKLRNMLEGDKQYVQFWEKLSSATKWIEKPITDFEKKREKSP